MNLHDIRDALANAVALCDGLLRDERTPQDQRPSIEYVRQQCYALIRTLETPENN